MVAQTYFYSVMWVGKAAIPEIIRKHDSWGDKGFCLLASRMKNGVALLTDSVTE